MKRFNSPPPPLPASEQAGLQPGAGFLPSNQRLGRDLLPQSQLGRISSGFIHFFCVVFSRFKIKILWFNISSSHNSPPPTLLHTPSQGPLYVARLCGMKALPLHHAGTSLHCTDGWLKGLLFVSWFCIWQGRRRIRWLTAVITLRRTDYLSQTFSKPSTVFQNKRRKQTNK